MARFKYVGGQTVQMTAEEEAAHDAYVATSAQAKIAAQAAYVPPFIGNRQFRKALRDMSQATINAFVAYVAGASDDIKDYWQYEPRIFRNHPNVEAARVALSRTQANIDTFFRNAAKII